MDNVQHIAHLVEKTQQRNIPTCLLSLDKEKAFDRAGWSYLHAMLYKICLGWEFIPKVMASYVVPTACIRVNGWVTRPISLHRGTRQGCPLLPLLFVLEPLVIWVRELDGIKGIPLGGQTHKINLDDPLLTLTQPELSLPCVVESLQTFEVVSDFKINMSKSFVLHINILAPEVKVLQSLTPFQWSSDSIKYLGLHVTPTLSS